MSRAGFQTVDLFDWTYRRSQARYKVVLGVIAQELEAITLFNCASYRLDIEETRAWIDERAS